MASQQDNLNGAVPAAPASARNVEWQGDPPSLDLSVVRNISAYMPAATTVALGLVKPDGVTIEVDAAGEISAMPTPFPAGAANEVAATPNGSAGTASLRVLVPADLPVATNVTLGVVVPDGSTITADGTGKISSVPTPLPTGAGNKVVATPNGSAGAASLRALVPADLPVATNATLGVVEPDGSTITADGTGKISSVPTPLPTGAGNKVVATPNGSAGTASLRALVPADLPVATNATLGVVEPDGSTITADGTGKISSVPTPLPAGTGNEVVATPNGSAGAAGLRALASADLPVATGSAVGAVRPDGTTITVDGSGKISAAGGGSTLPAGAANLVVATPNGSTGTASLRALAPPDLPIATANAVGAVKPDGSTITVDSSGKISATAAGGSGATLGANTFTGTQTAPNVAIISKTGNDIGLVITPEFAPDGSDFSATVLGVTTGKAGSYSFSVAKDGEIKTNGPVTTPEVNVTTLNIAGTASFTGNVFGTTASAGSASALPSAPQGYLQIKIAGYNFKIPYYNA